MFALLLGVIYLTFISLGLPDSLLGAGWPVMHIEMGVPLAYAGIVSMLISANTIASSLLSERLTKKFGTGFVTAASVFLTAAALWGFAYSTQFWMLCLLAFPFGFGAGGVDAALNNYIALHYKSRHMSWLHCFWGVGAAISPNIMSYALTGGAGWGDGYMLVAIVQSAITAALLLSLPLWRRRSQNVSRETFVSQVAPVKLREIFRTRGVKLSIAAFFCYIAMEAASILWTSSYFVIEKGLAEEIAARYSSFLFIGMTAGRFLGGFVTGRLGDKRMIRLGICGVFLGIILLFLPFNEAWLSISAAVVLGAGFGPIYPAIIHSTPSLFGKEKSQAIIGVQMASAYTASMFMPPLFGLITNNGQIMWIFPIFLVIFAVLLVVLTEVLNKKHRHLTNAPS